MKDAAETLEFPKIQSEVASFAHTELGQEKANALSILKKDALIEELSYTKEAIDVMARYGYYPIDGSPNLKEVVEYAARGGVLSAKDLEDVAKDALTAKGLKSYFSKVELSPLLLAYAETIPDLDSLEITIHEAIGPDLEILDSASPLLKNLRIKKKRLEAKSLSLLSVLLNKYKPYLNGTSFALRNGHYALPVINSYRSKVPGLLQDISSSGETIFIEPQEILMIHNQIAETEQQEKEEIARILRELSAVVARERDYVLKNNEMIGYLDFLAAKSRFSEKYHCSVADVSPDKEIVLFGARHPLLDQKSIVPNDFALYEKEPLFLISGPNAGGKTVALKTLGLLVMMHESGLPIPAKEGGEITYVEKIHCDIGDNQSLEENLSTFAAHISNVSEIFKQVGPNDLVLLDEIGTGTSPQEGEAIAYAATKYLLSVGSFALISSHFNALKAFALNEPRIVSASMLFDEDNLRPTYALKRGLPGESYAFEVAERYGLSKQIVDEARHFLGQEKESDQSKGTKRLLELIVEEEKEKKLLEEKEAEFAKKEASFLRREEALKKQEEHFNEALKEKEQKALEKAKKEVGQIIAALSSPDVKLHQAIEAKRKIEELETEEEEEENEEPISIGDYVLIPSFNVRGKVVKAKGNQIEIQTPDGLSFKVSPKKVRKVSAPAEQKKRKLATVDRMLNNPVSMELNIIGLHIDEALPTLERYLDSCRLAKHSRVRIIHGLGSGALRNMVQSYCKKHSEFVASFEDAGQYEGGLGATIIYLK